MFFPDATSHLVADMVTTRLFIVLFVSKRQSVNVVKLTSTSEILRTIGSKVALYSLSHSG